MKTLNNKYGKIYLIPSTLGDTDPMQVLPLSVKAIIGETDHYIVENEKSARRFIKSTCPEKAQNQLQIQVLNKYTPSEAIPGFLSPCLEGLNVGVISEAGCPGIADPGAEIAALAHEKDITTVPLVGPSSIFLALMASGMNGQSFAFNGYLPIDKTKRRQEIKKLEKRSADLDQSQIFIETPYRNDQLLADLSSTLKTNTRVCVACDITLPTEFIHTKPAGQWKKNTESLHKRPCIFIIHAR
ncbi:SAM-dependent methyltransferase [Sinomicrobium weinanense]|uniref:SAM-dependent methyltransferase n=1 Tax=Sinomicrobium weinanense TaxID=2842200 RepID=A0A926Q4G8_9FLAO|nr:SAM-dependent methyltransferase [Sinomicrobium weinanense]MBC9797066.1 SAM-dependent methyltransferase [Sinomicrobium weinanense]MBU3122705.1 SAM-dependent methyltransferase [Sinomicrobium weinanense]